MSRLARPQPQVPSCQPKPQPQVPTYQPKPQPQVPTYQPKPQPQVPSCQPRPQPQVPSCQPRPQPQVPTYQPKVEIYHNGTWGTVCDDGWGLNDAAVVCGQLGCGTALSAPQSAHFGVGTGQIWLDDVTCSGSERSLTECQHKRFGKHDCSHSEDAGVVCSGILIFMNPVDVTEVPVTLQQTSISLTSPNRGLVWGPEGAEVTRGYSLVFTCSVNSTYHGGVFSLISSGSNVTYTKPAVNQSASFNFPVAEYEHRGNYSCVYEVTLSSRKFTSPAARRQKAGKQGTTEVVYHNDVVRDGQIRLAGSGSTRCSGRVEIFHNGTWGTVCDDRWDLNDAEVACRELGCGTPRGAPPSAHFGEGTGQIWLSEVACSGSEMSLAECQHGGFGTHNCGPDEDAGVVCSGVPLRLSGSTRCSGGVEIYHSGAWGTVCDDGWDLSDAEVACRELGCGTALRASKSAFFGEGTGQVWLGGVACSGGVPIRLVGPTLCSGRVQIYYNGTWGPICFDGWDLKDAEVVCRELGCGTARRALPFQSGEKNGRTWLDNVACSGSERSLTECQHGGFGQHDRSRSKDAGVACSAILPKPSIYIHPVGEVTWGQSTSVTCSISPQTRQLLHGTFTLSRTSGSFSQTQTLSTNSATFSILKVDFDNEGLYQCQYSQHSSFPRSDTVKLSVTDGQIRLDGSGSTRCSGRVEIYHNGAWGTVCDDSWDLNDATVVCRQLGCGTALTATQSANFGQGTGQIWLDDVACSGSERSLAECQHKGFGTHNCGHSEDAGVVCSASLPKPSISMSPVGEATWGQDVDITCSVSTQTQQLLRVTFILIKASGSFQKTKASSTNSAAFNMPRVDFDNEGSYQCQYQTRVSSQVSSPLSDSVRLSVTVSLPKPSMSMDLAGEAAWGQDVGVTCSISTQHSGGTFVLQQTSGSFRETRTSSADSATFRILRVNFENEGSYRCQYQTRVSSRDFSSPLSDPVRLSVTVPLQPPSISLTSPNRGLVWGLEGAEVTRGYSLVITCSLISTYPGGVFSLISSGSNVTYTEPAVNQSASFNFPVAEYEHQGNYSCVYEVTLSSRKFTFPVTAPILVVIKMPLLPLVSSLAAGGLLLLLLVLAVVCLVTRRRRRRARHSGALVQTQLAVRASNEYENNEEEEDYVNVDPVYTKRKLREEAGSVEEEESDDYEDPESDHDYEEADPGVGCIKAEEVCFSVEESSEEEEDDDDDDDDEEEEESSDGENDYENVTEPFGELSVAIYGEQEDINIV
ncbi:scavenger receptor cysteine-rich domain-containing protein DMBT1-like [Enoplosus armatus]|uniref:scavenger receptor cysteine-rich domain-containing protein DMBT1-like n=1 Tax=Enoplosus armatus TaxID=215367 RepID=UPI0039923839